MATTETIQLTMKKALDLTQKNFESSSGKTPEYLAWHRLFKREFTEYLVSKGCPKEGIQIGKPNHFDMSGFFSRIHNGATQIWYFRVEDLRWSKSDMLIRTAKSYSDYHGGKNESIPLNSIAFVFDAKFNCVMASYESDAAHVGIEPPLR